MKKLFIMILVLLLAACLLPAAAGARNDPAAKPESKILTVAEGETAYSYEGMTVYNNGGTVYNRDAAVYNNGGIVYNNGSGIVYNNAGTVYAAAGTVFNNAGKVYRRDAEVFSFDTEDAEGCILGYYEFRFAGYYEPYVTVEGLTTEPGAESMIISEDSVCRVTPRSGWEIRDASCTVGSIDRNGRDGSVTLRNVTADTVLTLQIEKVPAAISADGTYNCA
ncbi:MAG: hypothetical protein IKS55_11085 [Oscillospiraceae bacterium]|nr:hypothetical protein [Oscillospiraceae bacterium]